MQQEIFEKANSDANFAVGLGYGLAINFSYLDEDFRNEIFKRANGNQDLAKGLGFAIGHIFSYLSPELRNHILNDMSKGGIAFVKNLGEGLGHIFSCLDSKKQEDILGLVEEKDSEFSLGLGLGIGNSFRDLDGIQQHELLEWTRLDSQFGSGLGQGLGRRFPSLNSELQSETLKLGQTRSRFKEGLSKGLSYSYRYLDNEIQKQIQNNMADVSIVSPGEYQPNLIPIAGTSQYDISKYDDFALPNFISRDRLQLLQSKIADQCEEVSFSGIRENYCVCFIDMMDSTKIASKLTDAELGRYYGIFLNEMATIVNNFGGRIIKNAGDCLIYYFPTTSDVNNSSSFKDVLESGITMIAAHHAVNAQLHEQKLPSLSYRISAEYGKVELAKSRSSQSDDLFGSAMNVCAKINSKAPPNGIVIGEALYELVRPFASYDFEKIQDLPSAKDQYPAYIVQSKQKRNMLNPFTRTSSESDE